MTADHTPEKGLVTLAEKILLKLTVFKYQPSFFHRPFQGGKKYFLIHRFFEKIISPGPYSLYRQGYITVACNHDHWEIPVNVAYRCKQLHAIHYRHPDIGDNCHVRRVFNLFQRYQRTGLKIGMVAVQHQCLADSL
jgi:hypothetical protein